MMPPRHTTLGQLDTRLAVMDVLITRLSRQVDQHEQWHKDMLERAVDSAGPRRLAVLALVIASVSAIAALLAAVAAFTGHGAP